jgi:hypothetical protein
MPIPPGGTCSWYVPNIKGLTANQTYSAVVQADQQVYATVNLATAQGTSPSMGETYNGVDSTQVAPMATSAVALQNYHGFTSNFVVQNTGTTAATVTATISGVAGSTSVNDFPITTPSIAPNASYTIDLSQYSGSLGDGFHGAATFNGGSNNIAVIANNYTPTQQATGVLPNGGGTAYGYLFDSANASTTASGSSTVYAPGLYNNYYGYNTSLTIANVDTSTANVTVTYSNGVVDTTSCANLQPNASCLLYTPNVKGIPVGAAVSATITSAPGSQKLVAVVNEGGTSGVVVSGNTASGGLASYNGFASGFLHVFAPGLVKNYYGFSSSLTVQNVDTVTAPDGSISIAYSNTNPAYTFTYTNHGMGLAPGASFIVYLPNDTTLPSSYNGGATITSTTAKVVGLINISGAAYSDQLFSTNAFGQ